MANVKISGLPAASTLTGAELVPVVQSGVTSQTTLAAMPYVPSGTGAVTTTVQTKLRETVSVKDFGAVGDGVTDDTAAFTAALASTATHIFVPQGTYLITSTLSVNGKTITGPYGGSQHFQTAYINHSSTSTGSLFSVTSGGSGSCIKNLAIIGGNGSFCITSSDSYVVYDYIVMEPYNGGGIQILSSGIGSSSSKLSNCQWVGPASATSYTGYEIDVNGGDVLLDSCTAIRGALGVNVKQGQTVILRRCSLNKQLTATPNPSIIGYSSATQFNTAGIKLSGTAYKQAITIDTCYIESCQNSIYVESCESLNITNNLIDDAGVCGFKGDGNSLIYLKDTNVKNVTISNNRLVSTANGTVSNPFYTIYFNSASNTIYSNNYISITGSYAGTSYLTTSTTTYKLANTIANTSGSAVADYDPSAYIRSIVSSTITPVWAATTAAAGWTNTSGRYYKDQFGFVHLSGYMSGGSSGTAMTTLPAGFVPAQQESFIVNASGASGVITVFTSGVVQFVSGTGTNVYLSGITFSTT